MANADASELVTTNAGETFFLRAAKAEDEELVRTLLEHESSDDIRCWFFSSLREFDHLFDLFERTTALTSAI